MSRKEVLEISDDYDGKLIGAEEEWDAITFSVNGVAYSLDLRAANQERFNKDMQKWIDRATKVGRIPKAAVNAPKAPSSKPSNNALPLAEIREWANKNGYTVSEKGRIPKHVVEAYEASLAVAS